MHSMTEGVVLSKFISGTFAIVLLESAIGCSGTVETGYGDMPSYCVANATSAGVLIGAVSGAVVGAAVAGEKGAAIGAASGAVVGGLAGAGVDAECRRAALQRALERAERSAAVNAIMRPIEYISPSDGHKNNIEILDFTKEKTGHVLFTRQRGSV